MTSGTTQRKIEPILFVIIALSPMAMGSVHLPVVFAFFCALLVLFLYQARFATIKHSKIGWLSFFIAALCVIQLVPLPAFLSIKEIELFATAIGNDSISWRPLSVEPFQSADRGLRFITIGLLAFVITSVAGGKFYRRANFWVLVGGWVVLAFGLFLWLSKMTDFFGFEQSVRFRAPSPFVNTNHGATYFALLSLASVLNFENGKSKPFAIISGVTFLVIFLIHGSLGVNLIFLCLLALYTGLKFRPKQKYLIRGIGILSTFVAIFVLLIWMDLLPSNWMDSLASQSGSRWELTLGGLRLAKEWPILGAGLGSTDSAILAHIDWTKIRPASIPTLENELLEFFGTGGILFGFAVLFAHLFFAFQALKTAVQDRSKRRHRWHALFWLFFIAIASLHFPWFTLGLAFPMVLFIQSTSSNSKPLERSKGLILALTILSLICLSSIGFWFGQNNLKARPLASEMWIEEATKSIKEGDFIRANKLAKHAKEIDPRPRTHHYLARVVAKLGEGEKAIDLYRFAFDYGSANNQLIGDMLADVGNASDRNLILEKQNEEVWLRAARITQYFFNADEAIALAFDAIQNQYHVDAAKHFAAEVFIELGQPELARIWTETQNIDGTLLTSIYLEQNDFESFFAAVEATQESKEKLPLYYILKNQNKILSKDKTRGRVLLKRVYNEYCASPIDGGRLKICWQSEGRLKMEDGDLEGAEKVYRRLYNRSANPKELATFYLRQKKCSQIKALIGQQTKEKSKSYLSNLLRKCSQH